jgi:uncharacterized protein (DUF2345 family)
MMLGMSEPAGLLSFGFHFPTLIKNFVGMEQKGGIQQTGGGSPIHVQTTDDDTQLLASCSIVAS